jgi:hypothetical protein
MLNLQGCQNIRDVLLMRERFFYVLTLNKKTVPIVPKMKAGDKTACFHCLFRIFLFRLFYQGDLNDRCAKIHQARNGVSAGVRILDHFHFSGSQFSEYRVIVGLRE